MKYVRSTPIFKKYNENSKSFAVSNQQIKIQNTNLRKKFLVKLHCLCSYNIPEYFISLSIPHKSILITKYFTQLTYVYVVLSWCRINIMEHCRFPSPRIYILNVSCVLPNLLVLKCKGEIKASWGLANYLIDISNLETVH